MAEEGNAQSTHTWPIPKFFFTVKFDDTEIAFQEVSGLDVETQVIEYRHGNSKDFAPIKMPGLKKHGDVTLKKAVLKSDNKIFDWFNEIKMNTIKRKTVTISLMTEDGSTAAMVWKLTNAFPSKITSTDLKSQGNEAAIETLVLAHESLSITNA
jgi:phage tail-like protein